VQRELIYAPDALADLEAATAWLTQPGSGPVAWRKLMAIRAAIEQLRGHPCRYPIGQHPGVRELPCPGGYRALYELTPDTGRDLDAGDVVILRIYGPGQDRSRVGPEAP